MEILVIIITALGIAFIVNWLYAKYKLRKAGRRLRKMSEKKVFEKYPQIKGDLNKAADLLDKIANKTKI